MENLESNGLPTAVAASTATTAKTEVMTADNDANGVSASSEPLMVESNSEPTTATPAVLFGGEDEFSGEKERLQEERDKVKNVPNKKPDVSSGGKEKVSGGKEKLQQEEDEVEKVPNKKPDVASVCEEKLEDSPNKNTHDDNPKKNNATLGDGDDALAVVSEGEEKAKEEEKKVENNAKGSGEREMEEEGKVENTPKKANKRKRIKKNKTPGDAGDTVASISKCEEKASGAEKKGEEDDERGKVGSIPKKANRRRRRRRELENTIQRGTGNAVSGGEGSVVCEEKGVNTPKESNRLKWEKTMSVDGDAVAVISGGEEQVEEEEEEENAKNNPKKKARRRGSRRGKGKKKSTTFGDAVAKDADKPETSNVRKSSNSSAVSVVSRGEEKVALEEKGVNTPKESNRLKRKKTKSVDDGDAVAVISGGEEMVEDEDGEIVKNNPKKKARKRGSRGGKGRKTSTTLGDAGDAVAKDADRPETSNDRKSSKRVKGMGMIFMCNSKTKKDCYIYKVLGMPASKKEIVEKVYEGMRLFLYDIDLKLLYGIYKAAGPGGYNIEHKAFKSAFPSQVRFTILDECLPLPEEKFKSAIKDNYYGKNRFNCELTAEQVKNLCGLFQAMTKDSKPKQGGRREKQDRDEKRRHSRDEKQRRSRDSDRVKRHKLHGDSFSTSQVDVYERETYAPQPLPPTLPWPSYEREAYTSTPLPPHLPPQLHVYERPVQRGYYRRDPPLELHDHHLTYPERRDQNKIEYQNYTILYREPLSYRDPFYPALPPGYHPPSY